MSTNAEYYPTHDRTSCSDTDACNATAEGSTGCARCTAIAMDQADTLDCPACGGSGHIGDVKQPAQMPAGSIRLWDAQWVSIVNHDNAYNGWSTNDAVNHAVRMTERYIAANVAQNNLPPLPAVKP